VAVLAAGEEWGVSAAALAWCGRFGGGIVAPADGQLRRAAAVMDRAAEGVVPVEHTIRPGSNISN
jgi:hypothetical protein